MTLETRSTGTPETASAGERQSHQSAARPPRRGRYNLSRLGAFLGPGLVAACAGNDAGGIATYAQAGAAWKYDFVWLMVVITICLVVVQEMCARMGAVTGQGLVDLIRERFGVRMTAFAILSLLIANGGTVVSEFAGIAASLQLFHISKYVSVPLMAVVLWWLVVKGSRARVETVFVLMSAIFLVYIPAAILARPNWGEVLHAALHPRFHMGTEGYTLALVALIGTTITPYMQVMLQSSVAEKKVTAAEYPRGEKWDTIFGCIFSDAISIFIIVATAVALFHGMGKVNIDTADQAARALVPAVSRIAGPQSGLWASYLFAAGLFGASMLAGAVLPLSTAYCICEAVGWQSGVDSKFQDARSFYTLFTGILAVGAALALIPGVDPLRLMFFVQALEGCILPIILVFIMLLVNDRELMPELRNGPIFNVVAWLTTIVVGVIAVAFVVMTYVAPLFGRHGG
ncbi:MAG: Nramp family divalent metal transporter [Chloroflexi bacterium]|nr:Nramp family divalent metal transporter [Chloroflexota bacterium]